MPRKADVIILGGGAAGLAASIAAARAGRSVALVDRMPRTGKKLLVTGGGRCNLSNRGLRPEAFDTTSPKLVASVLEGHGAEAIARFFGELGLILAVEGDRLYPASNQAASVLKVLDIEVRRLGIAVETGFEAASLERHGRLHLVTARDGRSFEAKAAVLACGGKSYPALGSDGSGHEIARRLGHRIVTPVPSCVPLLVKDPLCHLLQGQRIRSRVTARIGGRLAAEAEGDLLFAAYGLSGTAVLDVSTPVSAALNRNDDREEAVLLADLVPFLTREELGAELERRIQAGWERADLLSGILPEKFAALVPGRPPDASLPPAPSLVESLKSRRFTIRGTRGWNEAEFTSGGVDAREVEPARLESKLRSGVYFAGEILDVQGPRGGFNLAWAWASGARAGEAAAAAAAGR